MKAGFSFGVFFLLIFAGALVSAQTRPAQPAPETRAAVPPVSNNSNNNSIPRTSLEMKVVGVLAIGEGDDRRSSAIIALKGSKAAMTYSPGQAIDGNSDLKLVKVRKGMLAVAGRVYAIDQVTLGEGEEEFPNVKAVVSVSSFTYYQAPPAAADGTTPTTTEDGSVAAGATP